MDLAKGGLRGVVLGWIGDMAPIENKCSAISPSWAVVIG